MNYKKMPGQDIDVIGKYNKQKPTISIITPFYNGGKTLKQTANAVFNQTYPYFEWIIVDDGSKDKNSLKELENISKLDKRIKVFHKENAGPSVARDYAVSKSSADTEYLFFLDCDDLPDKTMLECLYWTLKTHEEASFAYTAMINFGDREFIWEKYLTVEQEINENLICISSLIKKSDFLEVGGFGIKEKAMYEDWNLWLKLLAKGKIPIRVNAALFWYRVSNTGEFSRAKKNNKEAMKYVEQTGKKIQEELDIIQFPREGKKYDTVKEYSMILPDYEKTKKKTLLFIFPWMVVGGADIFNYELIKRLDKEKFNIIILTTTPSNNPMRQQFEEYATVYDLASFLDRNAYINFTDYIIKSRNVDFVMVSNTQYGYYMIPYLKGKYPHIPFIDYIHSIDNKDPRLGFGRCAMDLNNYLVRTYCCNNFTKEQLENNFNCSNVETLYIGTDINLYDSQKFNKQKLLEKYDIPKGKKIISFIARLSEEKRPEMFINIAKKLLEERKDLFFVIAGDGPLMNSVSAKITEDFKLLGMIKEIAEIYAISDVTVNCSSLEGLALTSYESLAMGVPVVSTDVGGQKELIDSTVGAIVHYNKNATKEELLDEENQYVEQIEKVLNNLEKIKNNCRKKIEDNFTLDIMVDKFTKIIDETIKQEKNKEPINNNYMEYNLALESLHKTYFYYVKNYVEENYGIYYDYKKKPRKKGKSFHLRAKVGYILNRAHAKEDAKVILDCLRTIKRILKEFSLFVKFFLQSFIAIFKIIYKLIKNYI